LNQNKNTNIIVCKNSGNCPYSQNFGTPRIGAPRLKPSQPNGKSASAYAFSTIGVARGGQGAMAPNV